MKILLVITGLGVGGAERLITNLADRFTASGHDVTLAYFHGPVSLWPGDKRVRLVDLGIKRSPLALIRGLWRLRRLVRELKPDVVNSHLVHANLSTRLLRLVTPMPRLVSSAHNTNEGSRFRMVLYRLTDRLADISTNVSDEAVQAFVDQGALRSGRMVAIRNGIDAETFSFDAHARQSLREQMEIGSETPLLLAVGSLSPQKDYPNLIRALADLRSAGSEPRLLIVGDGPLRTDLEALARSLDVAPLVHFLGIRKDVRSLMSAADVFVLSSAWEGLPVVLLEAMSCGLPIVATECGGVRSLLADTGFLAPPRDSNRLASVLVRVMGLSVEQRRGLGARARSRVIEHYSITAMSDQYLAAYRSKLPA